MTSELCVAQVWCQHKEISKIIAILIDFEADSSFCLWLQAKVEWISEWYHSKIQEQEQLIRDRHFLIQRLGALMHPNMSESLNLRRYWVWFSTDVVTPLEDSYTSGVDLIHQMLQMTMTVECYFKLTLFWQLSEYMNFTCPLILTINNIYEANSVRTNAPSFHKLKQANTPSSWS